MAAGADREGGGAERVRRTGTRANTATKMLTVNVRTGGAETNVETATNIENCNQAQRPGSALVYRAVPGALVYRALPGGLYA